MFLLKKILGLLLSPLTVCILFLVLVVSLTALPLSPYRPESFDGIVKNKLPGKLFFSLDPSEVPLYRTYVLCTQGRRNI